jgi:anti-sigma factor RsiW
VTTPPRRNPLDCANPLPAEILMDYWLGALAAADEDSVEQHLMTCDECGDRLRDIIVLADSLRVLARSGSLQVIISDQLLEQAAATGLRIREYAVRPNESIQCTVAADDDLLVARLAVDVSAASRIDLSWCDSGGVERQRMADIPVGADAGSVLCQQSITWAKASPTTSLTARLLAVDEHGVEQLLGEYTFHHTRTIPGPAGWLPPQ